ncbi:MAG: hypothetical protein NWE86_06350 [Candidatus Bathyarchaeota archaeon]|nr:hypothetical protein [Candidatus Bathyarchaeota archaeon]
MKNILTCPKCGSRFDISYSRAFACSGCPSASLGNCGLIKCPNCSHEFPKNGEFNAPTI